jgi:hypothetical protein
VATLKFNDPSPTPQPPKPVVETVDIVPSPDPNWDVDQGKTVEVAPWQQQAQITGEITIRDIPLPYLGIVQKTSKALDINPAWLGQYNIDELLLGPEITVTIFQLSKYYEENLEFGSTTIPKRFNKVEEARLAKVDVREVAQISMVVHRPRGQDTVIPAGDIGLIPCKYMARKSAYPRVIGTIIKDNGGWLKGDLASGSYKWSVDRRQGAAGSWFSPKLAAAGKTPDAVRNAIKINFGL